MKKIILISIAIILPILLMASGNFDYHLQSPTTLYVGTPFHLSIQIKSGINDSIYSPKIDTLDIFILKNIKQNEEIQDSIKISNVDMIFAPFDTGNFKFPALEFTVKPQKGKIITYKTPVYNLIIQATITDTTKSISDIASPITLKLSIWEILIPIILIVLVVWGIIYLIKHIKKKETVVVKKVKVIPSYQQALQLLKKMRAKQLLEKGEYLAYFFELSYVLRFFLELQLNFNAVEMTTNEIRKYLKGDEIKDKSEILSILNYSDKVKFAKFVPNFEDGQKFADWMEDYFNAIKKYEESKTLGLGEK